MMHCAAMSNEQGDAPGVRYLGLAPYLYYADATEAVEWLVRIFGFTEKLRFVDSAGVVFQARLTVGDAEIQLACAGEEYWAAKGVEGPVGQLNTVYVDVPRPQDQPYGARVFTVSDIGGNSWTFWQQVSDVVALPPGWREIRAGISPRRGAAP
jgi:uncharacterized glyoxalase superfamily protein PhnB